MKQFYIFILITLNSYLFQAQNVNIPDQNFKDYLVNSICADLNNDGYAESNVDTNNDGEIQVSEAEAVFLLEINQDCLATSFIGINAFINLNEFKCENTLVSDLDLSFLIQVDEIEILENTNLVSVNLGSTTLINNRLTIDGNPNLETLNLSNVTSIVGSFYFRSNSATASNQMNLELINIQSMGGLFISDNNPVLPMNIDLSSLISVIQSTDIRNNNIGSINLMNLTSTRGFEFTTNTTVSELNLGNLTSNYGNGTSQGEIIINGSNLTSVNLSSLVFSEDRIIINSNIAMNVDFSNLNSVVGDIVLSYNAPIVSLPNLQTVNRVTMSGDIQHVDLNALETGGVHVNSDNDDLSTIDLSSLVESDISLGFNQLTELDLPNLVTVNALYLDYNQLTSINMPLLETASYISLESNQLDSFELSNVTLTSSLTLDNNPLTNLELTNANIHGLSFNNTGLSSLDLSSVIFEQMYINNCA